MSNVITTGVFDILHKGHINILTQAKSYGDVLIVGVQSDVSCFNYKGKYPVLTQEERSEQLLSLPFVDKTYIYDGIDQIPYLIQYGPKYLVQGSDWQESIDRSEIIEFLSQMGIELKIIPYTAGISTTDIAKRISQRKIRRDHDILMESLKLKKISDLKFYELNDPVKTKKIATLIFEKKIFTNPVMVTEHNILLDGYNRVEALRMLGIEYVPALEVAYEDVELDRNIHFVDSNYITRLSEFDSGRGMKIVYPPYTKRQIIDIAMDDCSYVPSGSTWHKFPFSVIRINVPLDICSTGVGFQEHIASLISDRRVRYYPINVYDCCDWD